VGGYISKIKAFWMLLLTNFRGNISRTSNPLTAGVLTEYAGMVYTSKGAPPVVTPFSKYSCISDIPIFPDEAKLTAKSRVLSV